MRVVIGCCLVFGLVGCGSSTKWVTREVTPDEARASPRPLVVDTVIHDDGTRQDLPPSTPLADASVAPSDRLVVRGPFKVGDRVPGGGVVRAHPHWVFVGVGAAVLATTYAIAVAVGVESKTPNHEWAFVPFVGPTVAAASAAPSCSGAYSGLCVATAGTAYVANIAGAVVLGAGQIAGAGLIAAGFAMPQLTVAKTVSVTVQPSGNGATISGQF